MLTQSRLKDVLHYNETTGIFIWKMATGSRAVVGSLAGTVRKNGYIEISIDGRLNLAHRLAWLYVHGEFPPAQLDHINRVTADNRIINLRPATQSENNKNRRVNTNNTSGYKGVSWHVRSIKWQARAKLNGKSHYLGLFPTAEAASAVYEAFAKQNHGEYYRRTTGDQT